MNNNSISAFISGFMKAAAQAGVEKEASNMLGSPEFTGMLEQKLQSLVNSKPGDPAVYGPDNLHNPNVIQPGGLRISPNLSQNLLTESDNLGRYTHQYPQFTQEVHANPQKMPAAQNFLQQMARGAGAKPWDSPMRISPMTHHPLPQPGIMDRIKGFASKLPPFVQNAMGGHAFSSPPRPQ